jgi:hypothetical protein
VNAQFRERPDAEMNAALWLRAHIGSLRRTAKPSLAPLDP